MPFFPRAVALVWKASPGWTLAWSLLLLIQGVLPAVLVNLTRIVVDRIAEAAGSGARLGEVRHIVLPAVLMAALLLFSEVLRAATRVIRTAQSDLVRDHVSALIHECAATADIAQFESPEYHDRLYRARSDSHDRPVTLVQSVGALVQHAITLLAMALVLIHFGWWVPLALIASTLPALFVVGNYALRHHRWTVVSTPSDRRTWYYDWLLCTREPAAEIRLFELGPHFAGAFQRVRARLRTERVAISRAEGLAEIAAAVFALGVTGVLLLWVLGRTIAGTVTLGELAMFVQAFTQGQRLMRSLLDNVGQIWSNILFLDNLFGFLAIRPQIGDPPGPRTIPEEMPPSIEFSGIRFSYPGSSSPVFDGFDLKIPAGSTAALLGVNGAGKSTLFKLLCRFYDPEKGAVKIGGVDLRDLRLQTIRGLLSVLFQEPVRYSETLRKNIAVAAEDHAADDESIFAALDAAGARPVVDKFEEGLGTILGTWFSGGAELSVGEWSRLALARAALKDAPILLLDEPTATMDSWAEAKWIESLDKLVKDRTTVLITHRLTTAMHADRIHVVDNGRIVESGTHRELRVAGGPYQDAWDGQFG